MTTTTHHSTSRTRWLNLITSYAVLIFFALFTVFPFAWMVITSFKSGNAIFELPPNFIPDKFGQPDMFDNYIDVLTRHNFIRYTANSFFCVDYDGHRSDIYGFTCGLCFCPVEVSRARILIRIVAVYGILSG